jgi:hypothetical protein
MPPRRPPRKKPKLKKSRWQKPVLTVPLILEWADEFHANCGSWPNLRSGRVGLRDETWLAISQALKLGLRGLSPGSSLAKLLALHRRKRNKSDLPALKEREILLWAKVHFQTTGQWPTKRSGEVAGLPGQTWGAVDSALRCGIRGLPAGSSLASLLAANRLKRHPLAQPALTVPQILEWAKKYHHRHGKWPNVESEPVDQSPDDTWHVIDRALRNGTRGLPGGSSLPKLLSKHLGARKQRHLPPLSESQIIRWAKAYLRRTGKRPTHGSGPIDEAPGETWCTVEKALSEGRPGLSRRTSLARLLTDHGLHRYFWRRRAMSIPEILDWADAYHARYHKWPKKDSGVIADCREETWKYVDTALRNGYRGLPGGSSLAALLHQRRGIQNGFSRVAVKGG